MQFLCASKGDAKEMERPEAVSLFVATRQRRFLSGNYGKTEKQPLKLGYKRKSRKQSSALTDFTVPEEQRMAIVAEYETLVE